MESIYTQLALYGSKNESARTDTVFYSISEVWDCKVSLRNLVVILFTDKVCFLASK